MHGVVLDRGQRTIDERMRTCDSPLKVAMYVSEETLDIKQEKARIGEKRGELTASEGYAV